jgi:DNA-directed RNA polymerase subunit RPC12/RpoP
MDDLGDGTYVCAKCGHIVIPAKKDFGCSCRHCAALNAFKPQKEQAWPASA